MRKTARKLVRSILENGIESPMNIGASVEEADLVLKTVFARGVFAGMCIFAAFLVIAELVGIAK